MAAGGRIYLQKPDDTLENFNKKLVDSGHACIWDFSNNEFNPADWWNGTLPSTACIKSDLSSGASKSFVGPTSAWACPGKDAKRLAWKARIISVKGQARQALQVASLPAPRPPAMDLSSGLPRAIIIIPELRRRQADQARERDLVHELCGCPSSWRCALQDLPSAVSSKVDNPIIAVSHAQDARSITSSFHWI